MENKNFFSCLATSHDWCWTRNVNQRMQRGCRFCEESEQRNWSANSLIILLDQYLIRFATNQSLEMCWRSWPAPHLLFAVNRYPFTSRRGRNCSWDQGKSADYRRQINKQNAYKFVFNNNVVGEILSAKFLFDCCVVNWEAVFSPQLNWNVSFTTT